MAPLSRRDRGARGLKLRRQIEKSLKNGGVPARKALVQEIRFEGRDRVVPCFRVPGGAEPKVRALARSVGRRPRQDSNLRRTV